METQVNPLSNLNNMVNNLIDKSNRMNYKSFKEYHEENPKIWFLFRDTALKAIEKGFKKYSSRGIFQIIRWHKSGEIKEDGFKVNNNYSPFYARMFEEKFPEHKGFFRNRKIKRKL